MTMSNFIFWKDEVADMPEQYEDGSWYDLETGLPFDANHHYRTGGKTTRWVPSEDVKENRKIAKFYGGKALTGTMKQKVWAESIRATILSSDTLSDEQKASFIDLGGFTLTAKFWIENRALAPSAFTRDHLISEFRALSGLSEKHYDTLARTCATSVKNAAKDEIRALIAANDFSLKVEFPNFDPYYEKEQEDRKSNRASRISQIRSGRRF